MSDNNTRGTAQQYTPQEDGDQQFYVYKTKEIGEIMGAATSTVRKYSVALEDEGYTFSKNAQNQRLFNDNDIVTFRKMYDLTKAGTLVINAAKIVANESQKRNEITTSKQDEAMKQLLQYVQKQDEYIQDQAQEIKVIKDKLNKLDKIDKILELLEQPGDEQPKEEQAQEVKEQEVKVNYDEDIYKEDKKKQKGLFNRIFRK